MLVTLTWRRERKSGKNGNGLVQRIAYTGGMEIMGSNPAAGH